MTSRPLPRLSLALPMALVLALPSCTSMRSVGSDYESVSENVEVGDLVRIFTTDGEVHQFEVTRIDGSSVAGFRKAIPFSEITLVQVERLDGWKTAGLIGGTTVGIAVAAGAYALAMAVIVVVLLF